MGTTPTTTNTAATDVDTAINDLVSGGVKAAEAATIAALDTAEPFFALPVISEITDEIIDLIEEKLGSEISVNAQLVGTFLVINIQTASEESGVSTALQGLMLAEQSKDPTKIAAAVAAYQAAQSSLVHFDGSATPQT